ncbi:MAG: hypothetical protein ACRC6R_08515 [Bacteroidales bacterium]
MPKAIERYTHRIKKQFGCQASWPPSTLLNLGDYGYLRDGTLVIVGNLKDLGVSIEKSEAKPFSCRYIKKDEIETTLKSKNQDPPKGSLLKKEDSGAHLIFKKPGSLIFAIDNAIETQIANSHNIETQLIELANNEKWRNDYLYVSDIILADDALIIVSYSDKLEIDLKIESENELTEFANIEKLGVKISTSSRDIQGFNITNNSTSTPLFQLTRLSHHEAQPLYMQTILDLQGYTAPEFAFSPPVLLPDHLQRVAWDAIDIYHIEKE